MLVGLSRQRGRLARRFFTVFGTVIYLRASTIVLTSLPDPSPRCTHWQPMHLRPNIFVQAARGIFPIGYITCVPRARAC